MRYYNWPHGALPAANFRQALFEGRTVWVCAGGDPPVAHKIVRSWARGRRYVAAVIRRADADVFGEHLFAMFERGKVRIKGSVPFDFLPDDDRGTMYGAGGAVYTRNWGEAAVTAGA